MRALRVILLMLFAIFSSSTVMAQSSLPYFLLGDGHTAIVPVGDIAKWLHLDSSWNQSEKTAILSNSLHQLKVYDNSTRAFLDGKAVMLDFPSVSFEGKLFIQPKIFQTFNDFTINDQSPENDHYAFNTRLRLTNTETRTTLIFALADLLYHMRADFIGDGKWEDVFGMRSFHTEYALCGTRIFSGTMNLFLKERISHFSSVFTPVISSRQCNKIDCLFWRRRELYR